MKSSAVGDLGPGFPGEIFDKVLRGGEAFIKTKFPNSKMGDARSEYGSALMGLGYRYRAAAKANAILDEQLAGTKGTSTLEMQAEFGNFIFNLASCLECGSYAVFALAYSLLPAVFPFATDKERRDVNPKRCAELVAKSFPTSKLGGDLAAAVASKQFEALSDERRLLFHRAADGFHVVKVGVKTERMVHRTLKSNGAFSDDLANGGLDDRRKWVEGWMAELLEGVCGLINANGGKC